MKKIKNEQQNFWIKKYGEDYRKKNGVQDIKLAEEAWKKMLSKCDEIDSILECGSNIGLNIETLNRILPNQSKSIIEINPEAYAIAKNNFNLDQSFNGSILDSDFSTKFDLVFTRGVLIHIHPDELIDNLKKIVNYSQKYILIGEYFNRTPVSIEYMGEKDKLFKSDFGKLVDQNFDIKLIDYGFLWGHIYDIAGFDDITWWLFKK